METSFKSVCFFAKYFCYTSVIFVIYSILCPVAHRYDTVVPLVVSTNGSLNSHRKGRQNLSGRCRENGGDLSPCTGYIARSYTISVIVADSRKPSGANTVSRCGYLTRNSVSYSHYSMSCSPFRCHSRHRVTGYSRNYSRRYYSRWEWCGSVYNTR